MNKIELREKAEAVRTNAELDIYEDAGREDSVFEDDAFLHVRRDGLRACWYIGQELSKSEYNKEARSILNQLGIPKSEQKDGLA